MKKTAKDILEKAIMDASGDIVAAGHALCDGAYLEKVGLTDEDQDAVEEAYYLISAK